MVLIDCIICKSKQSDWTNPDKVREGFPIDRNAADTEALYHQLVDADGEIPKHADDFDTREGLTQKPLTKSDQRNITITHSYINGTTMFFKQCANKNDRLLNIMKDHVTKVNLDGYDSE